MKHFEWVPKGKLRLHQKPNAWEIRVCLPWLEAEIDLIRPEVLVGMAATGARGIFGKDVQVTRDRGRLIPSSPAPYATATVRPSSILRSRTDEERLAAMATFVEDLKIVLEVLPGKK